MQIVAGTPVAGQLLTADGLRLKGIALGEQDNGFAKLWVGPLGDKERLGEMRTKRSLNLFYLNLDAAGTDDVVLAPKNAKASIRGKLDDVVGDYGLVAHLWSVYNEAAFWGEGYADGGQGCVSVAALWPVQSAKGYV